MLVSVIVLFLILALGNFLLPANKDHAQVDTAAVARLGAKSDANPSRLIWLSLFGLLVWMSGTTGTWVFLERMGNDLGFTAENIGSVISIALLISAVGALLTGFVGDRFGRKLPMLLTNLFALAALVFLSFASEFLLYALSLCLFSVGWVAAFPYLLATVAAADFRGNLVVLASAALSLGGALGPGIAGIIQSEGSYMSVLVYGGASILAGLLIFLFVLKRLGAANPAGSTDLNPH